VAGARLKAVAIARDGGGGRPCTIERESRREKEKDASVQVSN
jgi:hypothetical protein